MRADSLRRRTILIGMASLVALVGWTPSITGGIQAAAAATRAPAEDGDWSMWGYDVQRTGHNPNETTLSPSTVPGLHALWTFPFAAKSDNAPVFASGVDVDGLSTDIVFAGDRSGAFYAVNASTGEQVWSRNLGTESTPCFGVLGVTDTAVIDRATNLLYVAGGDGQLYGLDLATGAIAPGWPLPITTLPNEYIWGAINMFGGSLYLTVASGCDRGGAYYGRVARVDPGTISQTAVFYVTGGPDTGVSGGGIWGWGGASIDPGNGDVYVATGNGFPVDPYEHFMYADAVVRLTGDLNLVSFNYPGLVGKDVDFGSTPMLFDAAHHCGPQFIAENKTGEILSYDRDDVGPGPVDRVAVSGTGIIGVAGYDPSLQRIYVGNPTDSLDGTYKHGLLLFKVAKTCKLRLAWQRPVGNGGLSGSPVTANGVVYFADGSGHQLLAFDEVTHKRLWNSADTFTSSAQTEPIVISGHVYATSGMAMYAFGL